jgi:hypothetical protein
LFITLGQHWGNGRTENTQLQVVAFVMTRFVLYPFALEENMRKLECCALYPVPKTYNMIFDFEKTMKEAPDAELIRIVITNRDDYQEAAITAAEAELSNRNLSAEHLSLLEKKQLEENADKAYKAAIPLEIPLKIVAFLLPGAFQFFIAGSFKANGYDRKANEVGKWTLYGIFFYITLAIYSATKS